MMAMAPLGMVPRLRLRATTAVRTGMPTRAASLLLCAAVHFRSTVPARAVRCRLTLGSHLDLMGTAVPQRIVPVCCLRCWCRRCRACHV